MKYWCVDTMMHFGTAWGSNVRVCRWWGLGSDGQVRYGATEQSARAQSQTLRIPLSGGGPPTSSLPLCLGLRGIAGLQEKMSPKKKKLELQKATNPKVARVNRVHLFRSSEGFWPAGAGASARWLLRRASSAEREPKRCRNYYCAVFGRRSSLLTRPRGETGGHLEVVEADVPAKKSETLWDLSS